MTADAAASIDALAAAPWAILPEALPLRVPRPDAAAPPAEAPAAAADPPGGPDVAVVRLDGVLTPRFEVPGWFRSCASLAADVEAAAETADAVALLIDSPGGSVFGVAEAADRIAAVAASVPVVACADHMAASAAYWIASACTAVAASPSAMLGSVGVISVDISLTRMFDEDGIDVHVASAGRGKAHGHPLAEMTDARRDDHTALVNELYEPFAAYVAARRGVPLSAVTDDWGADLMTAPAAVAAGMADTILTAAGTVRSLRSPAGRAGAARASAARAIVSAAASARSH